MERLHVADLMKTRCGKGCPKYVTQHEKGPECGCFVSVEKLSTGEGNEVPKTQEAYLTHKAWEAHEPYLPQETQKM